MNLTPEVVQDIINIPLNWDIGDEGIERGIEMADKYGVITVYGHITDSYGREYLSNGLNDVNTLRIRALLRALAERFNVMLVTMADIINIVLGGDQQFE